MVRHFIDFIHKEHLIAQGQRVLLAVSGGRDSVALTDLMSQVHISFAIAHCNFHLRPGECDRDEQFVRQLAEKYCVEIFVAQFDTQLYAKEKRLSVEEAAREQRYDFFEKIRSENSFDLIATAHHSDDSIETFFINLLRGTGIGGLHGILPRNGNIIRPMLCFGRDEINSFVEHHHLEYVEDCTNAQPLYLRNRIRLQLIPLLKQLSPSFTSVMQGNIDRLTNVEKIYRTYVEQARTQLLKSEGDGYSIDIKHLQEMPAPRTILFELLRPFNFSVPLIEDISSAIFDQTQLHESGSQWLSPTHRLIKDRSSLLLYPLAQSNPDEKYIINETDTNIQISTLSLQLSTLNSQQLSTYNLRHSTSQEAFFDYDKLHFPLTLRHWCHGDRFKPFGMKGSRLLSDFFTDLKLSIVEKERIWLLCDADDKILWVVNYRSADFPAVTEHTQRVLKITTMNSKQ